MPGPFVFRREKKRDPSKISLGSDPSGSAKMGLWPSRNRLLRRTPFVYAENMENLAKDLLSR